MSRLQLTFACGDYDRTRALEEGTVRPDGIDLTYLRLPVEETFFRMLRHREFDVAEMSLSSYVKSLDLDEPPFVALPVYTSRQFRHAGIFVNADAGIEKPEDLRGKVVGTPEWQLTAERLDPRHLADHYGVPVDSVEYRTGGQETPGRVEKAAVDLGERIRIQPIAAGQDPRRRCWPTARSTPSRARACRRPSCRAGPCGGCSPTPSPRRSSTSPRPGSSRSCTSSSCAGTSTSGTRGWRSHSPRRWPWPSGRRWPSCTTPRRCGSCCRG